MSRETLHILLVISKMGKGGAQRIVLDLANGLVSRGLNVDLLVFYRTPQDRSILDEMDRRVGLLSLFNISLRADHRDQFLKIISAISLPLFAFWWVARGRLKEYHIVHSNLLLASFFAWVASGIQRVFKLQGPKFVETFHADLIALPGWEQSVYYYLWRNRDALVTELRRRDFQIITNRLPGTRIERIPFGVVPLTLPEPAVVSRFRETYSITEDIPVILSITRLNNHEKKVFKLIEIISRLNRIHAGRFIYILVGDGPDKSNLQARVHSLGLDDMVIFTGYYDDIKVPCSLAKAFLITGVEDLVGMAGLQAASLGVPVISYQIDPDWENREPIFFNSNSPQRLAEEIRELMMNEEHYRMAGARASSVAKGLFSVDRMVSSYSKLYMSL